MWIAERSIPRLRLLLRSRSCLHDKPPNDNANPAKPQYSLRDAFQRVLGREGLVAPSLACEMSRSNGVVDYW
jgi:hypothetical protein